MGQTGTQWQDHKLFEETELQDGQSVSMKILSTGFGFRFNSEA
jgi:hypothetical protein